MPRTHLFVIAGFGVLLVGFFTLLIVGCDPGPVKYDETTIKAADHFSKIAVAYNQASERKRRGAITAEDLKPFLKQHGDPDALLISPLDGKPIVIVPGVSSSMSQDNGERMIVAYEQTGVNGKRMMIDIRNTISFATDEEFAKIKFAGGHKPGGG